MSKSNRYKHISIITAALAAMLLCSIPATQALAANATATTETPEVAAKAPATTTEAPEAATAAPEAATAEPEAAAVPEVAAAANQKSAYVTTGQNTSASDGKWNLDMQGFKIQAQIGLQGNIRSGAPIPVQFTITADADFEGILRVIVDGDEPIAYEMPVNLVAGNEKNITMAFNTMDQPYLSMQLENEAGRICVEAPMAYNAVNTETPLMGILSDDYTALNYFDRCNLSSSNYAGPVGILEMSEKNLPDNEKALQAMNYLLITSYDTSRLSQSQQQAILEWVQDGGVLILGTGPDYKQTLAMFDPADLTVTFDGYMEGTMGSLSTNNGSEEELACTAADGIWKIRGGEEMSAVELFQETENPLVLCKNSGKGVIAVCAFNPALKPVSGWKNSRYLADRLVSAVTSPSASSHIEEILYAGGSDFDYSTEMLLNRLFPAKELPDGLLYILLLAFVICGPVSYAVLRKNDKTQYLWILYPAEALVFVALILLSTVSVRIRKPLVSSLVVFEEKNGTTSKKVSTSILTPSSKWYELDFAPDLRGMETERRYYYRYDNNPQLDYNIALREDAEGNHIRLNRKSPFETMNLRFSGAGSLNMEDYLVTDYTKTLKGITGSVTNTSPYTMLGVSICEDSGSLITLGTIEPGQTVSFGEKDNEQMDTVLMDPSGRVDISTEEGEIAALTLQALGEQYQGWGYRYGSYGAADCNCYTYAYLADWNEQIITNDKAVERNVAVLVKMDNLPYSDYHNAMDISILQYTSPDGDSFDPNDGQLYKREAFGTTNLQRIAERVYVITCPPDYSAHFGDTSNTQIYAYNNETDTYDLLFQKEERLEFEGGNCPYIMDGLIRWKFTCPTEYDDYIPEMTLIGGME